MGKMRRSLEGFVAVLLVAGIGACRKEAPPAVGGFPQVGALQPSFPNNHLGYAITWYGLALVLVVIFGVWAAGRRRGR